MKTFDKLEEIVDFMLRKHKGLRDSFGGVTCYKSLRKPDGKRIPFEESRGFKIVKFTATGENTLSINQLATGYQFRGEKKHTMTSNLFLQDLVLINVYDLRAEFFSTSSIDFTYIVQDKDVNTKVQMLHEWINEDNGIIRAQWTHKDENIERLLDEISVGRKVQVQDSFSSRPLSLDDNLDE